MKHKRSKPSTVKEVKKRGKKGEKRKTKEINERKKEGGLENTEIENIAGFKRFEKISNSYKLRTHWLEIKPKLENIS